MINKTIQTPYIGDVKIDPVLANIYMILNDIYKLLGSGNFETNGFTGIVTFVE